MPNTSVGQTKLKLPIGNAVGAQYSPPSGNPSGPAAPAVVVPVPSSLVINGVRTANIDVRTMTPTDVLNVINSAGIPGVTASIDGNGRLVITGISTITGNEAVRVILGI